MGRKIAEQSRIAILGFMPPSPDTRRLFIKLASVQGLGGDAPRVLEESRGDRSEDEAANMSHVGNSSPRLRRCHRADLAEELYQKPDSDQHDRRDHRNVDEPAKYKECANLVSWVS